MNVILGFLPYIAFFLLESSTGSPLALALAAAVAIGLVIRSRVLPPHDLKILEVGTVVVFAVLSAYSFLTGAALSLVLTHFCVKLGMLAIVLVSLLIRRPFTLAYARQQVDPKYWNSPRLLATNYVITSGWAVAIAIASAFDLIILASPQIPQLVSLGGSLVAFVGALRFTRWYAARARGQTVNLT